ncbi:hypothetical protein H0H93_002952 [Arthromyces matolae]|nr:hypothetical protein H0H93_002952 [Arthromyces matolae]
MWWLDPGKEVLNVLFNRILAPYVENLDLNQVNYGIGQGQLILRNLRLKKGALDKFRLPVDVLQGHLGKLSLSLHWLNLGNQPVEILVEDVYLLVVPSSQTAHDPQEDENRAQAAKLERLENAELLHMQSKTAAPDESSQSKGLWESLIAKVINNLQIIVKNIHMRYEDNLSVPGHPFAAGVTLSEFNAVSVNQHWEPAFIESTAGAIHKLANLQSLALYFDTNSRSLAQTSPDDFKKDFFEMISHSEAGSKHQFILKPVSGEGRVIVNHKTGEDYPRFDVQLIFDEIGVALDDNQYRDIISLLDMYHVYARQRQYQKYRPQDTSLSPAKSRLLFAGTAIIEGIRERNRKWTWSYFADRRDDRTKYVDLFEKKTLNVLAGMEVHDLEALERKLAYEDIRFYRSIARSRLRKDQALRKRLQNEKPQATSQQSWTSWIWGSSTKSETSEDPFSQTMTDEQRKELYNVLDFDEKEALRESLEISRDSLRARIVAKLNKGSFALKSDLSGNAKEVISVVFDVFQANFLQRPDNFEASISLGGLGVFDATTPGSLYHQIVRVKNRVKGSLNPIPNSGKNDLGTDPFFFLKFEKSPLDERADSALTMRMRHMEIIYHKGYLEAIVRFLRPPASQLESVEALLNVASQTFEGLRKETRAGLEFALQTHKTIDLRVDLDAPVIVIPENVTSHDCNHLIVDAGHISIESNLVNKDAIRTIQLKRKSKYEDKDYRHLESLMYDKVLLKLDAAQFIIGNNLQSCLDALDGDCNDSLHLLERVNVNFEVQNSIVPSVTSLARFKVSGKLSSLRINFSDSKYKALMRLIDASIPKFGEDPDVRSVSAPAVPGPGGFQLPPMLFGPTKPDYNMEVDGDESDENVDDSGSQEDLFFEADDGSSVLPEIQQHTFELTFQVDKLCAAISRSSLDGSEKRLGEITFDRFNLDFALAKYDMEILVNLRSVSLDLDQPQSANPLRFISSADDGTILDDRQDLLVVAYNKVQKESPEYASKYSSIDQNVDIKVTTFIFRTAPEPIIALYDFIMSTFTSPTPSSRTVQDVLDTKRAPGDIDDNKMRVLVNLASVKVILIHDSRSLATLSLSTADVMVFLQPKTLRVTGRLGSLALSNDSQAHSIREEFNHLISIEGENFAEFRYQTFDLHEDAHPGIKSSLHFNAASIKFHFLEQPFRDIYFFVVRLAKLKGLYDAATQAAVQSAPSVERMQFEIYVKTPILVFPSDPSNSPDAVVMELGEITAHNSPDMLVNKITAGLSGIQLVSMIYSDRSSILRIIENIDIEADIVQTIGIDREIDHEYPDTQIAIKVSDVKLHLTQMQYNLFIRLSQSIPKVFESPPDYTSQPTASGDLMKKRAQDSSVNLEPELSIDSETKNWTSLDLVLRISAIKLHLYDANAASEKDMREHGIVKFALSDNTLRVKSLRDGSKEVQIILRSLTMTNTRPGNTRFREIIPAAKHDQNQFMILYTMSGSADSVLVVSVDSPEILLAIDPIFALWVFFKSPFAGSVSRPRQELPVQETRVDLSSSMNIRVDLHALSVSVLEDDSDSNCQSITLSVEQIHLSQQGAFAFSVNRLGMSLKHMGKPTESVRFLDDVDLTASVDSRSSALQMMTSIELAVKPVVFRASYGDISMITSIINKVIALYASNSNFSNDSVQVKAASSAVTSVSRARRQTLGNAHTRMSKEQSTASFEGFRIVLVSDRDEQPMLHFKIKPFIVGVKDWSGEVSRDGPTASTSITFSARERLDINISATFVELLTTSLRLWGKKNDDVLKKPRGIYAPYRIRNRTGSSILVWSDQDNSSNKDSGAIKILNDEIVDWRFDDWKTMREHIPSFGQHSIGLQVIGKPWEQLHGIPVDREGEFVFSLRPRAKYPNRLLCEVKVVENVKVITIRSAYKVENQTLYPLELSVVDEMGHPVYSLEKISPGQDYSLPIEAVTQNRIRVQPDQGFGYKWCSAIRFEDLLARKSFTIKCPHTSPEEAAFRFQAWVQTDSGAGKIPKINLKLRAPLELENLLPYNIEYRVYDRNTDQNWRSYLRKGGVMPVHSVELSHFVLLNVNIQDTVFKPSEFAIINTDGHSDFDIENRLILQDERNRKLELRLNYIRYPESGGAFKVQIYCPYIVINKTGLPFFIKSARSTRTGLKEVAGENQPVLSHPQEGGHEYIFKVGDSTWSKIISVEAPAAETALVINSQMQKHDEIHIGLTWTEGLGKYKLTKVITLTPRFFIKNNLAQPISFREHGAPPRDRSLIDPGERRPVHAIRIGEEKLFTIAYPGLNAQWSPPINIEDLGTIFFRIRNSENEVRLIRCDVRIDGSTIFVTFSESDEWPFFIENTSAYPVILSQQDPSRDDRLSPAKAYPTYTLAQQSGMPYAWDYPAAKEKKIALMINGAMRVIDIMEIGDLIPFKFNDKQQPKAVSLDVRADGHKQVLRITNYNAEHSAYKPRSRSDSSSLVRQDTLSSTSETFEAVAEQAPPMLTFTIDFAGIGVSLVNKKVVEVLYVHLDALKLEYTDSAVAQAFNLSCDTVQVDNQLHDALYPVFIQPTPLGKEASGVAALPSIQTSIVWLKDQEHGVLFVKYCSILLQALTVEADEDLLFAIYNLTQIQGVFWQREAEDVLYQDIDTISDPPDNTAGQELYFEILELQPIKLSLSFMRTERVSSDEKLSIRNPLAVVVNALTMTMGNVNDAPLELNALGLKDMRLTAPELQSRITYHYRQEVLRQLYRILGSADFIGNPVGLFTNVSSGVADIFYEPFHGVVMHGNKELGIGIAKGAASFVKKTVFGISDSVTKFTSSVGKALGTGLSAATFDPEYQARRRMAQRRNKPRHAMYGQFIIGLSDFSLFILSYGVAAGGEALASSVTSAMEGVLMKPIEGAGSEGAIGFFKGVGKGLVGCALLHSRPVAITQFSHFRVVTKPVIGVFDLASNVSEGIRNTTTVFDSPGRDRVRLVRHIVICIDLFSAVNTNEQPRHVSADGVLRSFSSREALGQYWMKDLSNGAFRDDAYVAHIHSTGDDSVVLLTTSRVITFWSRNLKLDWELPFTEIQGVTVEDTGIHFAHKAGPENDKFAFIPDKGSQSWFFSHVANVVKAFNAKKRMDN